MKLTTNLFNHYWTKGATTVPVCDDLDNNHIHFLQILGKVNCQSYHSTKSNTVKEKKVVFSIDQGLFWLLLLDGID